MVRGALIERIRRQIYGGQPPDDAQITVNLVNVWLNDAIAAVAKKNYVDNIKIDGVGYVNNGFYKTYKNIAVTKDDNQTYILSLPHIPVSIGANESVASLTLQDTDDNVSYDCIPLSVNQVSYTRGRRLIPNKLQYWYEGETIYVQTPDIDISNFTARVRMVSGGDSTDLSSTVNVPDDFFPDIAEYMKAQLNFQRNQPVDASNDGLDAIRTN